MTSAKAVICPYCGETQRPGNRCQACGGYFEPLSRQATHNAMGPWFVRNPERPFQPGCSYETLVALIERGQITRLTVMRGPTTGQFWTVAKRVPGVSHLLGYCHHCGTSVDPRDHGCAKCGATFGAYLDRNDLGLPEVRPLPWEAPAFDRESDRVSVAAAATGTRGLSSFATDEELLHPSRGGRSAVLAATESDVAGVAMVATATAADAPPPGVLAHTETRFESQTTRALQRRVTHQARTIRLLRWLCIVAVLGVAALTVTQIRSWISATPRSIPSTELRVPRLEPPAGSGSEAPTNASESPAVDDAAPPAPTSEDSEDDVAAGEATTDLAAPNEWTLSFRTALELAGRGADPELGHGERVQAYEEALQLLGNIAEHAPPEARPSGLASEQERVGLALERLRLKEFFP